MLRVGVVGGAGRMGSRLARLMREGGFQVTIFDVDPGGAAEVASQIGTSTSRGISELVRECDIIAVATPQHVTPRVLEEIRELLEPRGDGRVVFDISTFKREVMRVYRGMPRGCRVASVHPLFGPGAMDPKRHTVVVVPVPGRESDSEAVARVFSDLGFNVETVDLDTHEFYVGLTIGLSYALGYTLALYTSSLDPSAVERLSGTTFKHLSLHYKSILLDERDFILDVLKRDEVKKHLKGYIEALESLIDNPEGLLDRIDEVRERLGGTGELEGAYRRMYECLERG